MQDNNSTVDPSANFDDASVGETNPTTHKKIRKIVVDRAACIGARSCVLVAPKTFQMDDSDLAYVVADKDGFEDETTIKDAAEACPVLAIHLFDDSGRKIFPKE